MRSRRPTLWRNIRFRPIVLLTLAGSVSYALLYLFEIYIELKSASVLATSVAMFSILVGSKYLRSGLWSAAGISLVLLNLFNLGIFPELIFREDSTSLIVNRWLGLSPTVAASFLASSGILAFLSGSILFDQMNATSYTDFYKKRFNHRHSQKYLVSRTGRIFGLAGSAMTILGCVAWIRFAINSGITIKSGYVDYLDSQSSEPYLQLIYYCIGLGLVLACVSPANSLTRIAFAIFIIFAVWGFPVGLRGEVLFPLASAASVLAVRIRMPKAGPMVVVSGILLMLIAAVSISRQEGVEKLGDISTYSPLAALAELGSSIRVLTVMSEWHPPGSGDWAGLSPYLNPTVDSVLRLVFRSSPNPENMDAYLSTQIAENIGQIGGSVIASAFHSFGILGMILIMISWGMLLSHLELLAVRNVYMLTLLGGLTFAFQQQIRNDFASMPVISIMLIVIIAICWLTDIVLPKKYLISQKSMISRPT